MKRKLCYDLILLQSVLIFWLQNTTCHNQIRKNKYLKSVKAP